MSAYPRGAELLVSNACARIASATNGHARVARLQVETDAAGACRLLLVSLHDANSEKIPIEILDLRTKNQVEDELTEAQKQGFSFRPSMFAIDQRVFVLNIHTSR